MKTEKEVVLAYVDAFNRGDIDGVCELFASDAMIWGVLGWGSPAEARPIWIELMEALQIQLTVDAIIAHEGTVVARYTERGQSVRPFRGLGPTAKAMSCSQWSGLKLRTASSGAAGEPVTPDH